MPRPPRALSLPGLLGALSLLALAAPTLAPLQPAIAAEPVSAGPPPTKAKVVSVYDGDTFTLDTGDRVRLSGANTPELKPYEPFAAEARDAAEAFLSGKQVQLHYGATERDHYGRLIASVTVDGQDLAQHLLERGLAHVFIVAPCDMDITEMLAAQGRARDAKIGLWTDSRYQGALHITSFHANGRGDERQNVNAEYLRVANVTTSPLNLDGYRIQDISGKSYNLPAVEIPAGYTFEIRSGVGTNQGDLSEPLVVYLGSDWPIWNNDRDRATLLSPDGKIVDVREHEPKSRQN